MRACISQLSMACWLGPTTVIILSLFFLSQPPFRFVVVVVVVVGGIISLKRLERGKWGEGETDRQREAQRWD
jgi:hypothetical protein